MRNTIFCLFLVGFLTMTGCAAAWDAIEDNAASQARRAHSLADENDDGCIDKDEAEGLARKLVQLVREKVEGSDEE